MAGNTRGKLKENFEGIHRNFDWCMKHINNSLDLIASELLSTQPEKYNMETVEETQDAIETYPLYQCIKAFGEGIQTYDELANKIYASL